MAKSLQRFILTLILTTASSHVALGQSLFLGNCTIKDDPEVAQLPAFQTCIRGSTGAWIAHQSKAAEGTQPPILYNSEGQISMFVSPWVSLHGAAHYRVYTDRTTSKIQSRDINSDEMILQIGNNALSRHRFSGGRGRPVYHLDHQLRRNLFRLWNLDAFEAPVISYINYVYDNQLDLTVHATYGRLLDEGLSERQRLYGSGRIMYDIAALEGTRIVVGGYGDGLIRRAGSLGMMNFNGKGDETSIEVTRLFHNDPFDPDQFQQDIRVAFMSHEEHRLQFKFQYDDFYRQIRIGGIGVIYHPQEHIELDTEVGYGKHEDDSSLSHWYALAHVGVTL